MVGFRPRVRACRLGLGVLRLGRSWVDCIADVCPGRKPGATAEAKDEGEEELQRGEFGGWAGVGNLRG